MTLTEFLLARIAEDERHARKLAETDQRPVLALAVTVNHPQRILAECEAKRRIVEWATDGDHSRVLPFDERFVLATLALPYADHPDYDEGWKP